MPDWPLQDIAILPLPMLYGINCNKRGSGGNNTLRNSPSDKREVGCPTNG